MSDIVPAPPEGSSTALRGIGTGVVGGAAVTGLLLGIGHRAGTAWRPLNAAAHAVLGAEADGVWGFHGSVTPMGCLVVLTMSVAAAFAVALLARSTRRAFVVVAAVGVALAGYLFHVHVAARGPGGLAALLSPGELRAVYLVLAAAVVAATSALFPGPAGSGAREG
jgi:hypothetical protein